MKEILSYELDIEIIDNIYASLHDAYERLDCGTMNIKRCLNVLEDGFGYKPPKGYIKKDDLT